MRIGRPIGQCPEVLFTATEVEQLLGEYDDNWWMELDDRTIRYFSAEMLEDTAEYVMSGATVIKVEVEG